MGKVNEDAVECPSWSLNTCIYLIQDSWTRHLNTGCPFRARLERMTHETEKNKKPAKKAGWILEKCQEKSQISWPSLYVVQTQDTRCSWPKPANCESWHWWNSNRKDWKHCKVAKKEDPGNYRPNFPLDPGKVMEKLILETISRHIKYQEIIRSNQHGWLLTG